NAIARPDAIMRKAGGQSLRARQITGMGDAFAIEGERQPRGIKACIALDDVEKREVTQPHVHPPLGEIYTSLIHAGARYGARCCLRTISLRAVFSKSVQLPCRLSFLRYDGRADEERRCLCMIMTAPDAGHLRRCGRWPNAICRTNARSAAKRRRGRS